MPDTHTLTQMIKSEAQRLGFFACGMAKAQPVSQQAQLKLTQWLEQHGQTSMQYMENYTELRLDPRRLLPQAKTVVSLALNYTPAQRLPDNTYQIAAYAYGKDYHDIMRQRLYSLLAFIQQQEPTAQGRVCCDTAPILERYWAQQAGIGWIGKNHQLIIPPTNNPDGQQQGGGTMCFLGELLLNIDLDYDHPIPDRCGTCRRCIDACPTKALAHNVFLAEHCLSYQLIENRNQLSSHAQQHMGNNIYGCDQCQQACPWNQFATPTHIEELQPSTSLLNMTDEKWEQLDEDTYRTLFKGSAVKRAKYHGLMRNIQAAKQQKN